MNEIILLTLVLNIIQDRITKQYKKERTTLLKQEQTHSTSAHTAQYGGYPTPT